jgi:glucose/arabinose dehydrogenase
MAHMGARVRRPLVLLLSVMLVAAGLTLVPRPQPARAALAGLPPGFVEDVVVGGLPYPTAIAFQPDATMLVALKSGIVRVVRDGALLSAPFVDIRTLVHDNHDRGLLGLAVHPDFPAQPYVYLLYTHDPAGVVPDQGSPVAGRVSQLLRVEADAATGYARAKAGTEVVLLGKNSTRANIGNESDGRNTSFASCMSPKNMSGVPVQDCIPSDENSHTIGSVVFGPDGSLYVSSGDASNYSAVDPRAMRAQLPDSLAGKILRIDPITGEGLPDNPFFEPAAPNSNRSKLYSSGLRNPFRITVHPTTGDVWSGDVGWNNWEEINTGKGANFGWPCYEGGTVSGSEGSNTSSREQGSYQTNASTAAACDQVTAAQVTPPRWAYDHSAGGASANGGAFYTGDTYPAEYRNAQFVADYNRRWVKVLRTDAQGRVTATTFGTEDSGGPVQIVSGPDTNLYWMRYSSTGGEVRRIRYVGAGNTPPVATAAASPTVGTAPLQVGFSSAGTYDVDAQQLTYSWDFGDGQSSTDPDPVHTYTGTGVFDARLTVTDTAGASGTATVRVTVGNDPPLATIEGPADEATYKVGDVVTFSGRGSANGQPLPASALSWELRQGHNEHYHFATPEYAADPADPNRSVGSFTVDEHGDETFYTLCLTATVSAGVSDTRCVDLRPRRTAYTIATEPVGMQVNYEDEGLTLVGPALIRPIEGSQQTLSLEKVQNSRTFLRWDDGSTSPTRTFVTGTTPQTLTAVFENRPPTVSVAPTGATTGTAPLSVGFTAAGSDPEGDALTYTWTDGQGGTGSGPAATFVYSQPGTYTVRVTATDSLGASASATTTVTVAALPAPWVTSLVGTVSPPGSAAFSNGVFTVSAGGSDIAQRTDAFRFVHQPLGGTTSVTTRVTRLDRTNKGAKAGLMMRADTTANAAHVSVVVTANNTVELISRARAGAMSTTRSVSVTVPPRWLQLVRSGDTVTARQSADGVAWSTVGTAVVPLPAGARTGLAVTGRSNSTATTATFEGTSVS